MSTAAKRGAQSGGEVCGLSGWIERGRLLDAPGGSKDRNGVRTAASPGSRAGGGFLAPIASPSPSFNTAVSRGAVAGAVTALVQTVGGEPSESFGPDTRAVCSTSRDGGVARPPRQLPNSPPERGHRVARRPNTNASKAIGTMPALVSSMLLLSAVSPWHISAPRGAEPFHEVTADSTNSVASETPRTDGAKHRRRRDSLAESR